MQHIPGSWIGLVHCIDVPRFQQKLDFHQLWTKFCEPLANLYPFWCICGEKIVHLEVLGLIDEVDKF